MTKKLKDYVFFARHGDESLHRSAKARAAMEGISLGQLVVEAVRAYLARKGR